MGMFESLSEKLNNAFKFFRNSRRFTFRRGNYSHVSSRALTVELHVVVAVYFVLFVQGLCFIRRILQYLFMR